MNKLLYPFKFLIISLAIIKELIATIIEFYRLPKETRQYIKKLSSNTKKRSWFF